MTASATDYNKTIFYKNNTLIHNWFEESELRKLTGEGRGINQNNVAKKSFDPEVVKQNTNPQDNTFKRVLGIKPESPPNYFTYNSIYGEDKGAEKKYLHPRLMAEHNRRLFDKFLSRSVNLNKEMQNDSDNFRSFDITSKVLHCPKPFESYVGLRHMYTQDRTLVPREVAVNLIPIEKLKKMGKEAVEAEKAAKEAAKKAAKKALKNKEKGKENEEDEEDDSHQFWLSRIDTSDVYRSFTKGKNPWARSSGFTQPLQKTRGAFQYYQNAVNSKFKFNEEEEENNNENEDKIEEKEEEKFEDNILSKSMLSIKVPEDKNYKVPQNVIDAEIPIEIKNKIISSCAKKGCFGLRMLKMYLLNLSGFKSLLIDRNNFKLHLAKQAIVLSDEEIDKIFRVFDIYKSDSVNFIDVLNGMRKNNQNRMNEIDNFYNQIKGPLNYISFKHLISLADMNYHPEAINFFRTAPDIEKEYLISWGILKEDDIVIEKNFKEFFYDVSAVVENDEDFTKILHSLGYK